jgi:hypothetical protein
MKKGRPMDGPSRCQTAVKPDRAASHQAARISAEAKIQVLAADDRGS